MAFVTRPAVIPARYKVTTEELKAHLLELFPDHSQRRYLERLPRVIGVEERYFVRPLTEVTAPGTFESRNEATFPEQVRMATQAARGALETAGLDPADIDGLVTLHATGVAIPGLDVHLVNALGLNPTVHRTPITQLACAGGAQGLIEAVRFTSAYPDSTVLVVISEALSSALQVTEIASAGDRDRDVLIWPYLFGDAGAACVVSGRQLTAGLRIDDTWEYVHPGSMRSYGMRGAADGIHFRSTREAPEAVTECMPALLEWLRPGGMRDLQYAIIHPGGPQIIKNVVKGLGCDDTLAQTAWDSLRWRGNQGGTAFLDVVARTYDDPPARGDRGIGIGIGPGVVLAALQTTWCGPPD